MKDMIADNIKRNNVYIPSPANYSYILYHKFRLNTHLTSFLFHLKRCIILPGLLKGGFNNDFKIHLKYRFNHKWHICILPITISF